MKNVLISAAFLLATTLTVAAAEHRYYAEGTSGVPAGLGFGIGLTSSPAINKHFYGASNYPLNGYNRNTDESRTWYSNPYYSSTQN